MLCGHTDEEDEDEDAGGDLKVREGPFVCLDGKKTEESSGDGVVLRNGIKLCECIDFEEGMALG